MGYSFRLVAGFFYMHHPTDRITHTTAFVTPVVEHWLEWEIVQWVHPMKDWSDDPSHHERTLLPRSYISLLRLYGLYVTGLRSKTGNPLPPLHGLFFLISSKGSFLIHHPQMARYILQSLLHKLWVHHDRLIWCPIAQWTNALPWRHSSLPSATDSD